MTAGYTIRPFETIEEYRECAALQDETWGAGFSERVSPAILKVSQILGGVSAGAYDAEGALVGFVFGMTGVRDGELVHWSDMLAVRRDARDSGLGRALKAYQRERVLELGVGKMFWTFDPLQSRNAHLNFGKLGIIVREYVEDMYGQTDSPLHRGIGTDRFVALWLLDSARVRGRLGLSESGAASSGERPSVGSDRAGRAAEGSPVGLAELPLALSAEPDEPHPRPGPPALGLGNDLTGVQIPSDIASLMDDDPDLARAWRAATRATFTHYLRAGYEVREFVRGERASTYVLARGEG